MKPQAAVGETIRHHRLSRDLTQEELAALVEMHTPEISMIELGKRDPRLTTLVKIARALGLEPADLLRGL